MKPNWRRAAPQAERDRRALERVMMVACALSSQQNPGDDDFHLRGLCRWQTHDGAEIPLPVLVRTSLAGPIADELFFGRELDVTGGDYQVAHAAAKEVAWRPHLAIGEPRSASRHGRFRAAH
jgi:hypothetical protein